MAICLASVAVSFSEIFVVCMSAPSNNLSDIYILTHHLQGAFPRVFPLQLVWISSAILLCGGGLFSAAALMWAMAAEVFPEDRRQVYKLAWFSSVRD